MDTDNVTVAAETLLSHMHTALEKEILAYWALHKRFQEGTYTDVDLSLRFREERWKGEIGDRVRWFVRRVTEDNGIDRATLAQKIIDRIPA